MSDYSEEEFDLNEEDVLEEYGEGNEGIEMDLDTGMEEIDAAIKAASGTSLRKTINLLRVGGRCSVARWRGRIQSVSEQPDGHGCICRRR